MRTIKLNEKVHLIVSKVFLNFVVSLIGFIREHSNDITKENIDNMVSEVIIKYSTKNSYR